MPSASGIHGSPDELVGLLGAVASVANESSDVTRAVELALEQISAFTGWPVAQAFTIDDDCNAHAWLSWHDPDPRWVSFEHAQADLAEQVEATTAAAQLTPGDLPICLEITESVVMHDPHAAIGTLSALRDLGLRIAIDDFGTGYSSLAYLKWFPVDIVKIDRAFVASLDVNPADRAIIKAVVGLARELGLTVVAEGVETAVQLEALTELGCTHAQGFLLGRPEPPSRLHGRLVESRLSV